MCGNKAPAGPGDHVVLGAEITKETFQANACLSPCKSLDALLMAPFRNRIWAESLCQMSQRGKRIWRAISVTKLALNLLYVGGKKGTDLDGWTD